MNITIVWVAICLATGGLGVVCGLWLASHQRARRVPDQAAVEAAHAYVKSLFQTQSLAIAGMQRTARDEHAKALERQGALQVRRDEVLAAQLAELKAELKAEQQRSFVSMEAATTVRLENFLKALATVRAKEAPAATEAAGTPTSDAPKEARKEVATEKMLPASPVRAPAQSLPTTPSARPPELLLTPIQPPAPMGGPEPVVRQLTDAELDAMPPELPPTTPRRRVLPTPKSPAMGRL